MSYEIERVQTGKRPEWYILENGKRYESVLHYAIGFRTRKAAEARITELMARDARLHRLWRDDFDRVYRWTDEEEKQIDDYAQVLKANQPRWTLAGQFPIQDIAREQHWKDMQVIWSRNWIEPDRYHAEKRRVMAARLEAFKRVGVEL